MNVYLRYGGTEQHSHLCACGACHPLTYRSHMVSLVEIPDDMPEQDDEWANAVNIIEAFDAVEGPSEEAAFHNARLYLRGAGFTEVREGNVPSMEVTEEVKTYEINLRCGACDKGIMLPDYTEGVHLAFFPHKCTKCGHTEDIINKTYPVRKELKIPTAVSLSS